jgi:hypothetical protein
MVVLLIVGGTEALNLGATVLNVKLLVDSPLILPAASFAQTYWAAVCGVLMIFVTAGVKHTSLAKGDVELVVKQYPVTPFVSAALTVKVS